VNFHNTVAESFADSNADAVLFQAASVVEELVAFTDADRLAACPLHLLHAGDVYATSLEGVGQLSASSGHGADV